MPRNKSGMTRFPNRKPTAFDFFAGCGGLTLGLKQAGFDVLGAVEIDPLSAQTYRANHETVNVWETDIRNLSATEVQSELGLKKGELDLIAACPPCQGFSTLRTNNGAIRVEDPRNDLLFEIIRFTKSMLPRSLMIENVPGLAKYNKFGLFISQLKEIGYLGSFKILDAARYGVAQRRRRLIYIAGLHQRVPFANPAGYNVTVKDAIGNLPQCGKSGDPVHDFPEKRTVRVMQMIRRIPKDGGSRADLPDEYQLACHQRSDGFKDTYGRMAWGKVSPTITSGCFNPSKGRFLHPQEDRAITMREAALLQGFPIGYKFPNTRSKIAVASMIGNAFPPPFAAIHAEVVRQTFEA